jgi:uncharacterized membrane protein YfcA
LIGFACIAPATILLAPLRATIAHSLSKRHQRALFGCFLIVISLRMFYRAFQPE